MSSVSLPRERISSKTSGLDLEVRIDLTDCSIDVCSVDVPALFTENFDYEDLRVDFVHGVLTSDILGKAIYCHVPKTGYSARAKDTKSYGAITWVPLVVLQLKWRCTDHSIPFNQSDMMC